MNKEWFIFKDTHHLGPFSLEEVKAFYQNGEIKDQTLIWKEGGEKWEALSKSNSFKFLFEKAKAPEIELPVYTKTKETPPPLPAIPTLPKAPVSLIEQEEDLPPPIPLDAIIGPLGTKSEVQKSKVSRSFLSLGAILFIAVMAWFVLNERKASILLHIKGLMPIYLEKLEMTATKNTPRFEVAMALSLDGQTLWASTNQGGVVSTVIKLTSIPKKILGTESVVLTVKGEFKNHVGKFNRMILAEGSKFFPGEYNFHVEARQTHFINQYFKSLSGISFFKSLNKSFSYDGSTLIYAGTPREYEKKIIDYQETIISEMLKPFQDKLERVQTFESLLNATSQNYLMELEKAKTGKNISKFEAKFVKEISPLLQSLVVKAQELSNDPKFNEINGIKDQIAPYREQVLLGKQIGEIASDMITKTQKFKKLRDADKSALKSEFDSRARAIKLQIDLNIRKLEDKILEISN